MSLIIKDSFKGVSSMSVCLRPQSAITPLGVLNKSVPVRELAVP